MFKYVFIIPEAELKRRWFNFQVIITSSINSESYHNLVTKAKFYHISARLGRRFWSHQRMMHS